MSLQTRETMRDIYPNLVNQGLSGDYPGTAHGTQATPTDKYAATVYALFGKHLLSAFVGVLDHLCDNLCRQRRTSVV